MLRLTMFGAFPTVAKNQISMAYKLAKPKKRYAGISRVAIVRAEPEVGGVHLICLRGDPRALMPMFSDWHKSEAAAIRHCEKEYGIPKDVWIEVSDECDFADPTCPPVKQPKGIDRNTAVLLCQTPQLSVSKMMQVLEWVETNPSAEYIQPLLILQTQNWASMKGLDQQFHRTLNPCAKISTIPLWNTIEKDYESYRIWHAIRAVVYLEDDMELRRLIDYGVNPLQEIDWRQIEEAALKRKILIPERITKFQRSFRGVQGVAERWLEQRRTLWPKELDQDASLKKWKRPVLKAVVDQKVTERARNLRKELEALEKTLREQVPDVWAEFSRNPGASESELSRLASDVFGGLPLPPDLTVFYKWHLGRSVSTMTLTDDSHFRPMDLQEATQSWQQLSDLTQARLGIVPFRKTWFPILADGMGNYLVYETKESSAGKILEYWHDDLGHKCRYKGIHEWVSHAASYYATGAERVAVTTRRTANPAVEPSSVRFEVVVPAVELESATTKSRVIDIERTEPGDYFYKPAPGLFMVVKLMSDCWCTAQGETTGQALCSLQIVVRNVPQQFWRLNDSVVASMLRAVPDAWQFGKVKVREIQLTP